jgi:hypothetical protein
MCHALPCTELAAPYQSGNYQRHLMKVIAAAVVAEASKNAFMQLAAGKCIACVP